MILQLTFPDLTQGDLPPHPTPPSRFDHKTWNGPFGRIVLPNRSLTCDNLCVGHTDKKPTLGSSRQRIRLGQEAYRRPRVGQRSKERTSGSLPGLEITLLLFFCGPNFTPSPHLLCAAPTCPHVTKCPPQANSLSQRKPVASHKSLLSSSAAT